MKYVQFKEDLKLFDLCVPEIQNRYRPDLDGLRAIAVLSIMVYHLNSRWLSGGFIGVDVFFVISGFVVTGSLVKSQATNPFAFIGEFYARRLARIMPALVVVLCVSVLFATFFIPNAWLSRFNIRTALFAFCGLSNWVMQTNNDTYFAPLAEYNPYTQTWSLGVEEQFYLIVPIIIFLWLRTRRASNALHMQYGFLAILLMLCMASLTGCFYMTRLNPTAAFYFFGFRFWELGFGVLLFLFTCRKGSREQSSSHIQKNLLPWTGMLLIGISCFLAKADHFPWPWALPAVIGSLFVVGSVHADTDATIRRLLSSAPLLWIGKRSYSLYLWHWPINVLLRWTVGLHVWPIQIAALAACFACGALTYRIVELPLRHNARIETWHPSLRIAFFVGLTAVGWWSARHVLTNPGRYSLSTVSRHSADWYVGLNMPDSNPVDRPCWVNVELTDIGGGREIRYVPQNCRGQRAPDTMYVLGDSHATAYLPMFDQLSADTGRIISVYSFPNCPFIDFFTPMNHGRSSGCEKFTQTIEKHILDKAKEGDILFLPSLRMARYGDQWVSYGHDVYQLMYNPAALEKRKEALGETKQLLQPFVEKKLRIIFEAPKPVFMAPPFRCSDWFNRMNPICVGGNQQLRSEMHRLREPILANLNNLSHIFTNVSVWDPFPLLCPGNVCLTQKDGRPLYFDGDHISAYANEVLYPNFKSYIESPIADARTEIVGNTP